ncbi:MAG TPA: CHAD domain-containing protein [Solirubrobacteraceae bacterium]|nr:CHAD domain-containing protein [Solirubrobacteraceae bacterium]
MGALGVGLVVAQSERRRRAARKEAKRERRFGLLAGERPARGMRRIALAQLEMAIGLLRGEGEGEGDDEGETDRLAHAEAVHEARKALKRLRALMGLLEGELGEKRSRREQEALGEVAKSMAGARDAEVLVATLNDVLKRAPSKLGKRRAVRRLKGKLERERDETSKAMLADTAARERAVGELEAMRERVAKWELTEAATAIEPAGEGLKDIYGAGDRARRKAKRARGYKRRAQAMHHWRKHAKELRYALEALDVQGSANERLRAAAKRADALGEVLGEDHDLVVLAERVQAQKSGKSTQRLLQQIARRRKVLRKRALHQGARLYAAKPKKFVRQMCP